MSKYPRGSEWRQWDLHIHTPGTAKNDQYHDDEQWTHFLEKLESHRDIAVLGITDYFSIDNYLKAKKFQAEGRLANKYLIPNVELRILPVTGSDIPINLHVLFDPELEQDSILREFLGRLSFQYEGHNYSALKADLIALGRHYKKNQDIDEETAWKEGIGQFCVSYDDVRAALKSPCLAGHFLVAVSNNSRDGNSGIQDSGLRANRQEIYRMCDLIFSGNSNDVKYFLGMGSDTAETVIQNYGSLKPCIIGSDAHALDNVNVYPANRVTWIKADPTFNGLRQVIFEPAERVRIQETCPEYKTAYQLIDTIFLSEAGFWDQRLPINSGLTVIIGGRSTGKSTLLECIARKVIPNRFVHQDGDDNDRAKERREYFDGHLPHVSVFWRDQTSDSERTVDYFPQNYMYEIARDRRKVDALIRRLLFESPQNARLLHSLEDELKVIHDGISSDCNNLFVLLTQLADQEECVRTIGNPMGIQKTIDGWCEEANALKVGLGIEGEGLMGFETKRGLLATEQQLLEVLRRDEGIVRRLKDTQILSSTSHYSFNELSPERRQCFERVYDAFCLRVNSSWQATVTEQLRQVVEDTAKCQQKIEDIKNDPTYKRGLEYAATDKQYSAIQERIESEKGKLQKANEALGKRNLIQQQVTELRKRIVDRQLEFRSKIESVTRQIHLDVGDLSISAIHSIKEEELRAFLEPRLNKRSDAQKQLITDLSERYDDYTSSKLESFLVALCNGTIQLTVGNDMQNVVSDFFPTNWSGISYDLTYQGDSFYSMSPGKQAFVILKLLLEFSSRKCPILIDQPEDSLDNRAIYTELVTYLKAKKKDRQIILVSHNPNVVVGADAEQVIVANQDGNDSPNSGHLKFSYYSGSLEDSHAKDGSVPTILEAQGIREHVCDILEGGREAFDRREKKYGF